jgi:hypothetical protein
LFLVLGYFLREATRVSYIAALLESSDDPGALSNEFWWRSRFVLGFDLVALTLSFFALTRPSSRQFLELRTEPDTE